MTDENLTPAERDLFNDPAIEAAYHAWAAAMKMADKRYNNSHKQFLTRLRSLFQAGKLG